MAQTFASQARVLDHPDGTRSCNACLARLPLEKFKPRGKPGRVSGKRHTMCNRCLYVRYSRPNIERKTAEIQALKLQCGCADCGYAEHPSALEFDHRPGEVKLFNIGEQMGNYSMEKLRAEIAKCDVVCANCHAIRTTERRTLVT